MIGRILPGARGGHFRRGRPRLPRLPRLTRLLPLLALAASATACRTWQPTTLSLEQLIAEQRPERVRVTVPGGAQITLRNPILANDSLVAAVAPDPGVPFATARPGVPAQAVEGIEVAQLSRGRTIALGVGIVAISLGWARFASDNNSGEPQVDPPLEKDGFRPGETGGFRIVWRFPR